MVRRSTVDRSPQSDVYDADYAAGTGDLAPEGGKKDRTSPGWRGAGGRWLVWVFRIVVWAVLLLIGYRGVTAIMTGETGNSPAPAPAASPGSGFPSALAGAYALQFGQVYLNADPATASQRASELATFLPAGSDSQLGWNGSGSLQLKSEQVASVAVQDAHHALVTLLARVNGQLMELGVPVYSSGGALAVSGEPAWLPAPAKASVPTPSAPTSDAATQSELMSQLPAFFQAYASGDQVTIDRFLAPGTHITGLGGALTFGSLTGVTVPTGGDTRQTVATVVWHVPGQASPSPGTTNASPPAGLEMSYALTIVKRSGTWYISALGPSLQPAGSS
jgi:Conjugative transposon protein TcpC